jgi:hypothetical protein
MEINECNDIQYPFKAQIESMIHHINYIFILPPYYQSKPINYHIGVLYEKTKENQDILSLLQNTYRT